MSPLWSAFSQSMSLLYLQTLSELSIFLPRLLAGLLVLILGITLAKISKRLVVKLLETLRVSSLIHKTPVEDFLKNADVSRVENLIGSVLYWLIMLVVLHTTVSVLGLEPISAVLDTLLTYIPHVFSAILVLFFGVLLAGIVESLVKGSIRSIDGKASRLLGKVSSYLVITISVLAAISELGIASEFIVILFIGFVAMLSLGIGLAIGLGGQELVRKVLTEWYDQTRRDVEEDR